MKKACLWQSLIVVVLATLAHAQDLLPYQTIVPPTNDTGPFGGRVAVSGTSIAIGGLAYGQPRRVFVYEKNETTGRFEYNSILTNPNTRPHTTAYGFWLKLQNGILVVADSGDRYRRVQGYLGAVFVYRQNPESLGTSSSSSSYELLQTLRPEDGRYGGYYGYKVALSTDGRTIAVGSPGTDLEQGAIYVYTWNDSTGLFGAEQKVVTHEWQRPTLWERWQYRLYNPAIYYLPPYTSGLGYRLDVQNGLLVSTLYQGRNRTLFAFERSAADGLFHERSPGPLEECGGACNINITHVPGKVILTGSNELLLRIKPYGTRSYSLYASLGPLPLERLQNVSDTDTFFVTGGGYLVVCGTDGVDECYVFRKNVQTALWKARGTLNLARDGDCRVYVRWLAMDEEKTVVVGTSCRGDMSQDVVLVYELR